MRYERELARLLWERGFACIRGGASGAGVRSRFVPDLTAMRRGLILVMEVKVRSREEPIYVEKEKIEKLREFAERAGAIPLLAVKYRGHPWYFVPITKLIPCSTTYRVDPELVRREGLRLSDLEKLTGRQSELMRWLEGGNSSE